MELPHPVPEEYHDAMEAVIADFELKDRKFKGSLKIVVRAEGTRISMSEEIYCNDHDKNSDQKIFERLCLLLNKARARFGQQNFIFEILNAGGNSLLEIRVRVAQQVGAVLKGAAPVNKLAPLRDLNLSPTRANKSGTTHQSIDPAGTVTKLHEAVPQPTARDGGFVNGTSPNPGEAIDIDSMKYYPTDGTPGTIRKAFGICSIQTKEDLLTRLGTTQPTKAEWDFFIGNIRHEAKQAGATFGPSSADNLYRWLTKKMKWVQPFPGK